MTKDDRSAATTVDSLVVGRLGGLENLRVVAGSIISGKPCGDGFTIQFVRYGCYDVILDRSDLAIMHVICSVMHDVHHVVITSEIITCQTVRFHTTYDYYEYDGNGKRVPGSGSFDYIESGFSFLIIVRKS